MLVVAGCGGAPSPSRTTANTEGQLTAVRLLPPDAILVGQLRHTDATSSPWYARARGALSEAHPRSEMNARQRAVDDLFTATGSLTFAVRASEAGSESWLAVARGEYTLEAVAAVFAGGDEDPSIPSHSITDGFDTWRDDEAALIILDERTVVVASPPSIADEALARYRGRAPATGPTAPALVAAMERAEFGAHTLSFAGTGALMGELGVTPEEVGASAMGGFVELTDVLQAEAFITCRNEQAAADIAEYYQMFVSNVLDEATAAGVTEMGFLRGIDISANGHDLTVAARLDQQGLEHLLSMLVMTLRPNGATESPIPDPVIEEGTPTSGGPAAP